MDSSVSPKDEIWFLRVCHHISNALYKQLISLIPNVRVQRKLRLSAGRDRLRSRCHLDISIVYLGSLPTQRPSWIRFFAGSCPSSMTRNTHRQALYTSSVTPHTHSTKIQTGKSTSSTKPTKCSYNIHNTIVFITATCFGTNVPSSGSSYTKY